MEYTAVDHSFESEKNRRAFIYTLGVVGLFMVIAIFYTWPLLVPPVPQVQDLIDVNLGNNVEGKGDIQPLVKGEMAPENQSMPSSQKASRAIEEPSREVQASPDNTDKEAAPVVKVDKPKPEARDINKESKVKHTRKINPTATVNPNPAPRRPKIPLYKGGNGNGGNGAEQDNGFRNQGYKGVTGDGGSPGGSPDAYGDTPGGKSTGGMQIVSGLSGRKVVRFPNMVGDFNESAKVYVAIQVNGSGKVVQASISRGTTTSNGSIREIALQKAYGLKFSSSNNELDTGIILFIFKLKS
ncbi:MAG: hypothetical protein KGM98_02410 [Bacteroidota bacterium]|nr:hypothetical protein [Bacteroidota bacterium]